MSLNPPLTPEGIPCWLQGECVLLERKGMEIGIKCPGMSDVSADGRIFITSCRLVFVSNKYQ